MSLKKSAYNIEIENLNDGGILIFNSLSSSLGVMDKKTQDIYYNIESIDAKDIINEEDINSINILKENGFLIDKDLDEFKTLDLKERLIKYDTYNKLILTIAPTLNCNMSCPYCYEKKNTSRMTADIQEKLINFIKSRIETNKIRKLDIHWYGGEPLLEKDAIRNISKKVIEVCDEKNIEYYSHMVTNGVLLDYETALMLTKECRVRGVQITLDGVEQVNNLTRRLNNGGDSFSIITNNIENIKELINVVIRMNVSKNNIGEPIKLIEYITERGWVGQVHLYFAPVEANTEASACVSSICYTHSEFSEINDNLQKVLISKGILNEYPYPKNFELACGALRLDTYVIGPEGDFYKCWHHIGDAKKVVGNLDEGIKFNSIHVNWLTLGHSEKCRACNILPICRGGCPETRLISDDIPTCDYRKINYKKYLLEKYRNHLSK